MLSSYLCYLAFTPVWAGLGGSSWIRVRGGGGWVKVNKLLLLKQFSYHLFGRGSEEAHGLGLGIRLRGGGGWVKVTMLLVVVMICCLVYCLSLSPAWAVL